jgi:DNA invertase Pin-like site-specific DNA recombinase
MARRLAAVPDQPGRVVLYVRVSALMGRGGDDFHSPDVQLGAMRRATVGMREVGVVEDIDRTGRHFSREGIERIRSLAEAKKIDAVAVYDVSRLGRNVRESLTFLTWLADHGVTILSACEQVDTSTPAGRLMLTNMLAIAEYRSDELGRSWSATIARRQARGQHHGTVPLGYIRTDEGTLARDPVLGPVIEQAWKDYAAGVSIRRIAEDVAAARGRAVMSSNLKTIFRRRVYLGHIEVNGEIVASNAHGALVDQKTWDDVQRRLVRDSWTPARNLQMTWALVGLAHCPAEHRLQRAPRKMPTGEMVERLICGMSSTRAAGGCPGIGAPRMDLVEKKVLDEVRDYISRLRTNDAARAEHLARAASAAVDEKTLKRRLTQVTEAIAKLAKAWGLGDLTDDEYAPVAELRAEAETIRKQLAAVTPPKDRPTPEQLATAAEVLMDLWPDATPEERNRMLRPIVARVVVRRAKRWREPVEDCTEVQFL